MVGAVKDQLGHLREPKLSEIIPKHGITGKFSIEKGAVESYLSHIKDKKPEKGLIFQSNKQIKDKKYRDVDVFRIDKEKTELYDPIQEIAKTANQYFNYNIDGIEQAQVMRYQSPSNGYGWHIDIGAEGVALKRKISVSVLLNENYEGGELVFRSGDNEESIKPKTGEVVAFSSFVHHKVNPVTKGKRLVLVVCFTGPCFR